MARYSRRQLDARSSEGSASGTGSALTHSAPPMSAWPLPSRARYSPRIIEGLGAGGQLRRSPRRGDGADRAELALDPGDQEDQPVALAGGLDGGLLGVALDGEGDGHVREDDDVVHGEDWE